LGLWEEACRVYEQALHAAPGPLVPDLSYFHADSLMKLQQWPRAAQILTTLAEESTGKWAPAARFHLATIDFHQGRFADCTRRCLELWHGKQLADTAPLLHLLAKAYESQGDYDKAARCFAGQPPEELN